MNENLIKPNEMCRTCLSNTSILSPVVDKNVINVLKEWFSIQITKTQLICVECRIFLQKLLSFKDTCRVADQFYEKNLQNASKIENTKSEMPYLNDTDNLQIKQEEAEATLDTKILNFIPCFICIYCNHKHSDKETLRKHVWGRHPPLSYTCSLCELSFDMKREFMNHAISVHETIKAVQIACDLCKTRVNYPEKLQMHRATVHVKAMCPVCEKQFSSAGNLKSHFKTHNLNVVESKIPSTLTEEISTEYSNEFKYVCKFCSNRYKTISSLSQHQRAHKREPIGQCPQCFENFSNSTELATHIRNTHHMNESVACPMCELTFYTLELVNDHLLTNHVVDNVCPHCSKKVVKIKRHMRNVHSTPGIPRAFKCDECSKVFRTKESLSTHMTAHRKIGTRLRTICNVCGGEFLKIDQHMERIHGGKIVTKKTFVCRFCKNLFSTIADLRQHQKNIHQHEINERVRHVKCHVCNKMFHTKTRLYYHQKYVHEATRAFRCTMCAKTFKTSNDLQTHTRMHTDERPFGCGACGKRFRARCTLNKHRLIHTGERPFECAMCEQRFRQRHHMLVHLKLVHENESAIGVNVGDNLNV